MVAGINAIVAGKAVPPQNRHAVGNTFFLYCGAKPQKEESNEEHLYAYTADGQFVGRLSTER